MTNLVKKLICIAGVSLLISGCNLLQSQPNKVTTETLQSTTNNYDFSQMLQQVENDKVDEYKDSSQFIPSKHHKILANYVEQMALDLTETMRIEQGISIAVASFVDLDATLKTTNQLGNQLSETFMHQLQKFGYNTVDFKTADLITVNNQGDFAFSRDTSKLAKSNIASHILSGTLIYRENGVEVNARVINVQSKRLAASSRKLIPLYVLNKEDIYLSSN